MWTVDIVMLHLKQIRRKERGNITWRKQKKCKKESRKVERKGRKENEITKVASSLYRLLD